MPRGKKTGGRDFKPGQSGNPGGRPKIPEELRKFKTLSADEVKKIFAKYARMTEPEVSAYMAADDTPIFEKVVGQGLLKAVKDGDYGRLNFILDRTIGKVVEKTEIDLPEPVIIRRRGGDEVQLAAEKKE
jgi:hypothetical protein